MEKQTKTARAKAPEQAPKDITFDEKLQALYVVVRQLATVVDYFCKKQKPSMTIEEAFEKALKELEKNGTK